MACKIGVVAFFLLGFLGDVEMACRAAHCVSKKVMSRFGDDIELTLRVPWLHNRKHDEYDQIIETTGQNLHESVVKRNQVFDIVVVATRRSPTISLDKCYWGIM
jgi:hypothetical protein